jgi:hypothetical protein
LLLYDAENDPCRYVDQRTCNRCCSTTARSALRRSDSAAAAAADAAAAAVAAAAAEVDVDEDDDDVWA